MSRIVTYEKCNYCGKEFKDFYISFGHPDQDTTWTWKCGNCGCTNGRLIKAMPMIYVGGWVKLSKLEEKKI